MSRPLPLLACTFWIGAWIADAEPAPEPLALAALAASALCLGLCATETDRPRAALAALAAAALALGAAAGLCERRAYEANAIRRLALEVGGTEAPVLLAGVAASDGQAVDGEARFLLDVERVGSGPHASARSGRVALRVTAPDGLRVGAGQRVQAWARLRVAENLGQPGAFDAAGLQRRDRVHAAASVKSVRVLALEPGAAGLDAWLAAARADARAGLSRHVGAGAPTALALAMLQGERAALDDDVVEAFQRAGTYHVLALSGAQVALIAAVLVGLTGWAGLRPTTQFVAVAPALALYALFVGGDVPVVRAAFAAIVALLGRALDQRADARHLLAAAALGWLSWAPAQARDLGCQLSFLATGGLVVLTPVLARRVRGGQRWIVLAVVASVAAQWALLPLLVDRFHRVAALAPLLNLVAVPLSTGLLALGLATWAADAWLPVVAPLLGSATRVCAEALLSSARLAPEWLDPRFAAPPAWATLAHLAALAVLVFVPRRERAALALLGLAGAGLLVGGRAHPVGLLSITAFDVGHGDALLVSLPGGERWVVDTGGWASGVAARRFGERVLGPALWARGVSRVDGLLLTHAHPDHVGAAGFLVRSFGVRQVVEGPLPPRDPVALSLMRELGAADRRTVVAGARLGWTGVTVDVLGPARPRRSPWRVRNDDSVVIRLRFGRYCALLTGDVEAAGEARLAPGRCDILKVAHHGSRTSTHAALLAEVRPALALISAGRRDPFGHPHPEVVRRLREAGAQVLITAREGAIDVETDGAVLRVRPPAPP